MRRHQCVVRGRRYRRVVASHQAPRSTEYAGGVIFSLLAACDSIPNLVWISPEGTCEQPQYNQQNTARISITQYQSVVTMRATVGLQRFATYSCAYQCRCVGGLSLYIYISLSLTLSLSHSLSPEKEVKGEVYFESSGRCSGQSLITRAAW